MKIRVAIIALLTSTLVSQTSIAQDKLEEKEVVLAFEDDELDIKPKPVDKILYDSWIRKNNSKFGEKSSDPKYPYKVTITFIVDTLGNVESPLVWRGVGFGFDKEAQRLILENPNKWIPGLRHGVKFSTQVYYQIDFTKNENSIMTKSNTKYK